MYTNRYSGDEMKYATVTSSNVQKIDINPNTMTEAVIKQPSSSSPTFVQTFTSCTERINSYYRNFEFFTSCSNTVIDTLCERFPEAGAAIGAAVGGFIFGPFRWNQ